MSNWSSDPRQSLFVGEYTGSLNWVLPHPPDHVDFIGLRAGGQRTTTILDTLAHAPPLLDNSWDWQIGATWTKGWQKLGWGRWASVGPVVSWRSTGSNRGTHFSIEGEVGALIGLQQYWIGSAASTRAWNLAIRIPIQYQLDAPVFSRGGSYNAQRWSLAILVGPSVLF
jgi:hypothetical protein